jgi:hypothetical protein
MDTFFYIKASNDRELHNKNVSNLFLFISPFSLETYLLHRPLLHYYISAFYFCDKKVGKVGGFCEKLGKNRIKEKKYEK